MLSELEKKITEALPGDMEAYLFIPLLIVHNNGKCYGVVGKAQAAAWQDGLDPSSKNYFHLEDMEGNRVRIDPTRSHSHASVLMDILDKKEGK